MEMSKSVPQSVVERIEEYDMIKCTAILLVVIGHTACPQILHNMCYSIHIPLFFLVSGCTIRGGAKFNVINDVVLYVKRKFHTFYIPFLLFVIPICLLHNVFYELGIYDAKYSVSQYIVQILRCFTFSVGKTEPFLPQLWFLKTLFLAEILYAMLHLLCNRFKIKPHILLLSAILSICLLPKDYVPHVLEVNVVWPIKAWIMIEIGRLVKQYNCRKWVKHMIVPFFMIWLSLAYNFRFSFQDSYGLTFILQLLLVCFGYFTFYRVSNFIKRYGLVRTISCYIGRKSLYLFFWHYAAFALINVVYCGLFAPDLYGMLRHVRFIDSISWYVYVLFSFLIVLFCGRIYDKAIKVLIQ